MATSTSAVTKKTMASTMWDFDHRINIAFLGGSLSGKSMIIPKFFDRDQDEYSRQFNTLSFTMEQKIIQIDSKRIKLIAMDVAGQDRLITPTIPKTINCIIAIYSIYDKETFDMVQRWLTNMNFLRKELKREKKFYPEYVILGNDINLEGTQDRNSRAVPETEARKLASTVGAAYMEVNATTGRNISDAFHLAARKVLNNPVWQKSVQADPNKVLDPLHDSMQKGDNHSGNDLSTSRRPSDDVKLFKKAVERKGSVSYLMVQCMPFGPPRVGKTCVYNLLINRPSPGEPTSRRKIGKGSLSTDALTGRTIINARVGYRDSAKAIVAKGGSDWSEVTTLDDEIAMYVETTKEQLEEELNKDPVVNKNVTAVKPVAKKHEEFSEVKQDELKLKSGHSTADSQDKRKAKYIDLEAVDSPVLRQEWNDVDQFVGLEDAVLNEITKPLVDGKVNSSNVQSLVKDSLTIFYTDTGGQPEFQEVLPALIAGPTMFLLTFSLFSPKLVERKILPNKVVSFDPLNALYQVRYDSSNDEFGNYESSFTVSDVLLQCLSSIACFKDGQTHQLMLEKDSGNVHISTPPISVLILGTHSDLVQQEDVEQVDLMLRQSLINVDLMDKGLIEEFESGKQLIIPINNFDPNDGSKLRQIIEQVVNRAEGKNGRSPYRIELPVHWLGLELYLRKLDQSTITYEHCVRIAGKFDIPDTELKDCLKYLHYKTGTIRYYSGVDELKNTIIIKPSIIFSAITKLITSTFIQKNVKGSVQLKFKQYGLFKESEIQHIFEENEKSLELTLNQFLALLRHLNILSRAYKMATSHNVDDELQFDYFLPCALTHAPIKDTSDDESLKSTVLVSFQSGFVPKGIFSGLLAFFSGLEWEIECHNGQPLLYRNQATFNINEHLCSLTMRAETKLLEFSLKFRSQSAPNDSFQAYDKLRKAIQKSLTLECETLGYGQNWSLGVYCTRDECQSLPPHVTTVDLKDGKVGRCSMTHQSFQLNEEQQSWFKSIQIQGGIPDVSPEDMKIVNTKIQRILTHRPSFGSPKGIAFVTGITEADGVFVDLQNVKDTFHNLKFIVYPEQNLTAVELASLIQAAANYTYPINIKFIAFYFAGHGGIDLNGQPFIVPLNYEERKGTLQIDQNILEPFRHRVDNAPLKNGKRRQCLFMFDCCLSESNMANSKTVSGFRIQNPPPDSVVAYATAVGSKSIGDSKKGGVWTRHLCSNLATAEKICLSKILINTRVAVAEDTNSRNEAQLPHHEWNTGSVYLNGQPPKTTAATSPAIKTEGNARDYLGSQRCRSPPPPSVPMKPATLTMRLNRERSQSMATKPKVLPSQISSTSAPRPPIPQKPTTLTRLDRDRSQSVTVPKPKVLSQSSTSPPRLPQKPSTLTKELSREISHSLAKSKVPTTPINNKLPADILSQSLAKSKVPTTPNNKLSEIMSQSVAKSKVLTTPSISNKPSVTQSSSLKYVSWRIIHSCLRDKAASCWSDLSLELNICGSTRDELKIKKTISDSDKLERVIREWIGMKTCEVSKEKIISVLRSLGLNNEAETLIKNL